MSLFYPITHYKWLKNHANGFKSYVEFQESIARKKIVPKLAHVRIKRETFLSANDNVVCSAPSHIFRLAQFAFYIFTILIVFLICAEFIINYLTMVVVIMPGDERIILASLIRIPVALTLTIGSILLAEFCFDIAFEKIISEKKIKYEIPDTINPLDLKSKSNFVRENKLIFFMVSLITLVGTLYSIYYLAERRSMAINEEKISGAIIEPLTLISLILPILGGLIMVYIKSNLNLILAYKAKRKFNRVTKRNQKTNKILGKQFSRRRMKIIETELSKRHIKLVKFKNYLEGKNKKIPDNLGGYDVSKPIYLENYEKFRNHYLDVLNKQYNVEEAI
jgi:hypothetical protein